MPPLCDQTGTPGLVGLTHFHSSTTSGSAFLITARTFASVSPRQSSSSLIRWSICSAALASPAMGLPSCISDSCTLKTRALLSHLVGPAVKTPQARTRRTRAAVVEAARSLFLERGYAATTIEAISDRADTPQATVYRLFASKLGILKAVLDVSIGGDDDSVAMADRAPVRAMLADTDPRRQLAGFAALLHDVMTRAAPMHRILADAARSDEDAAALLAEIAQQRRDGQQRVARSLARS